MLGNWMLKHFILLLLNEHLAVFLKGSMKLEKDEFCPQRWFVRFLKGIFGNTTFEQYLIIVWQILTDCCTFFPNSATSLLQEFFFFFLLLTESRSHFIFFFSFLTANREGKWWKKDATNQLWFQSVLLYWFCRYMQNIIFAPRCLRTNVDNNVSAHVYLSDTKICFLNILLIWS